MNPVALASVTPIWCTLKMFPLEYKPLEAKNVTQVGRMFIKYLTNHKKCDLKLCVAMDLVQGMGCNNWLVKVERGKHKICCGF